MLILIVICLVLSNILRVVHNVVHERRKAEMERYYQEADAFSYPDIHKRIIQHRRGERRDRSLRNTC